MEIRKLADLFSELKNRKKRRLVVVNAVDEHSLLAVYEAVKLDIVSAVLKTKFLLFAVKIRLITVYSKLSIQPMIRRLHCRQLSLFRKVGLILL